jgi:hypothetical protein
MRMKMMTEKITNGRNEHSNKESRIITNVEEEELDNTIEQEDWTMQPEADEATTPSIPVVGNTMESTFGRIAQRIGAINGKLTAVDAAEADQAADRVQLATVTVVTPMANQTEQGVGRPTRAIFTPTPKVGSETAVIIPLPMVGNKGNTTWARPQLSNIILTLTSQSEIHHRTSSLHGTLTLSDRIDMRQRMAFLARC